MKRDRRFLVIKASVKKHSPGLYICTLMRAHPIFIEITRGRYRHQLNHGPKQFVCGFPNCLSHFAREDLLNRHIERHITREIEVGQQNTTQDTKSTSGFPESPARDSPVSSASESGQPPALFACTYPDSPQAAPPQLGDHIPASCDDLEQCQAICSPDVSSPELRPCNFSPDTLFQDASALEVGCGSVLSGEMPLTEAVEEDKRPTVLYTSEQPRNQPHPKLMNAPWPHLMWSSFHVPESPYQDLRDAIRRFQDITQCDGSHHVIDLANRCVYEDTYLIQLLKNPQSALVQSLSTQAQPLLKFLLKKWSLEIPLVFKYGMVSELWDLVLQDCPVRILWDSEVYSWSSLSIINHSGPSIIMELWLRNYSIQLDVEFTKSRDWIGSHPSGKRGKIVCYSGEGDEEMVLANCALVSRNGSDRLPKSPHTAAGEPLGVTLPNPTLIEQQGNGNMDDQTAQSDQKSGKMEWEARKLGCKSKRLEQEWKDGPRRSMRTKAPRKLDPSFVAFDMDTLRELEAAKYTYKKAAKTREVAEARDSWCTPDEAIFE